MNIFTFTAHFGDENTYRLDFKLQRDKQGVVCKKCCSTSHYWKKDKWSYKSKSCKFRTSYVDIADYVELHITEKSSKDTTKETINYLAPRVRGIRTNSIKRNEFSDIASLFLDLGHIS